MALFIGMFDVIRDGTVAKLPGKIPDDLNERTHHLKAAGYYFDASMVGVCALPEGALLPQAVRNPMVGTLADE